ncbi:PepSY domain-containing protein [Pseudoalteromonas sp. MMG010]|uniref:PepSY domain-containing protein n=1 Tax=Pseudoalteromonas sp. MMG010 TaxID=2822685 RepID=UPI001B3A058E|nr:PepSY domain-containing protein [Pseudoalteromonas sp. MMG010]MBQ4832246.1 PepSY domain-containing protein [Pseudoalteromonas sp. MMG010]
MRAVFVFVLVSIFSFSVPLSANTVNNHDKNTQVSKKKAVFLAKKSTQGKTLKITEHKQFYTVRILKTDGHVVDLQINKKTGKVKKDQ